MEWKFKAKPLRIADIHSGLDYSDSLNEDLLESDNATVYED